MEALQVAPEHLWAIVDMGSNGIRFSISNLMPATSRIMPTLYQHRVGISLYDAQWSDSNQRQPINEKTIAAVVSSFKHFQRTCSDFGVPDEHVTVLATEATRTAINSKDFRRRIKDALGWDVILMPKEEEGRVGALGIASSLPEVNGLVMDLGGGSTQLSWLTIGKDNKIKMPQSGAVSMPYGAAAMSRRLAEADQNGATADLESEITTAMINAFETLKVPPEVRQSTNGQSGYTLYLSGGGFRGWGYLLMSRHRVTPYPIPVINGFKASRQQFLGIEEVQSAAAAALQNEDDEVFRISDRRASQVPAVAFFIKAVAKAIPDITEVRFCQGGVREGYLFSSLRKDVQRQRPLTVATQAFSRDASHTIRDLLKDALPPELVASSNAMLDKHFTLNLLEAFANMMHVHSTHSKDLQASAALRCTTSGSLAGVHGLLHESRAMLALLICARWGDEVPPIDQSFKQSLENLVDEPAVLWHIRYLGAVAALIAAVYPAGVHHSQSDPRIKFKFSWMTLERIQLRVGFAETADVDAYAKELKSIEKLGKKKNWPEGKGGKGFKVDTVPGTMDEI